jgi:ketosteroid isomerase-like protein
VTTDHDIIRTYYDHFNRRRLKDAAALVAPTCQFTHLTTRMHATGPGGYLAIAEEWLRGAPDAVAAVEAIETLGPGRYRVTLVGRGHRTGDFDMGSTVRIGGDGKPFEFRAVQEVRIEDGRIVEAVLAYDRAALAR